MNLLLSFFWALVSMVRLWQGLQLQKILLVYLAVQAGIVAVLFIKRREPKRKANRLQEGVAWASALLPLAVHLPESGYKPGGEWLAIIGVAISILAVNRLSVSFGVAPADRGLVTSGIYKLVRHPMYLGELMALLGAVISWISAWNALIVLVQIGLTVLRIRWEENLIDGYAEYRQKVKWRLLPLIW